MNSGKSTHPENRQNTPQIPSGIEQRNYRIGMLFLILLVAIFIFLLSILKTITSERHTPAQTTTKVERAFRGSIYSADHYTLSDSQQNYQAVIRGASIRPQKRPLFIKLFSIYSGIPQEEIRQKFFDKEGKAITGNIILSKNLNQKHAMQLKSLAYKLRQLEVFQSIKNRQGFEVLFGLDILAIGEKRRFPKKDLLSPIIGYVGKELEGRYIVPQGRGGLEKHYNKYLSSNQDGLQKGKRDVSGNIIYDQSFTQLKRIDGLDLHLNIPLSLQKRVEVMIDQMKQRLDADEIIVGIMESHTGKLLAYATTKRYNPAKIEQKDIPAMIVHAAENPYEAGSVIKPLSLAIALEHHLITPQTWINTHNGRFQISKKYWITDDEKFPSLTATDIIVHSSNIGISQIAWRLSGKEFREGLQKFGIGRSSGIDLALDYHGKLKSVHLLSNKLHRANSAYGYGMTVTFNQLLKAYSAFNNQGIAVTPHIVDYLQDNQGRHYTLPPKEGNLQAISPRTAKKMHRILKEVVKRGTGVKAQYPGLEIGGKTGTAHIAKNGHYVNEYHSSFYGFANDKEGHDYTLGVLVINAKKWHKYFASQSAVPTFKNLVRILVNQGYLHVDESVVATLHNETPLYSNEEKEENSPAIPPNTPPAQEPMKEPTIDELLKVKKRHYQPPTQKQLLVPKKETKSNISHLFGGVGRAKKKAPSSKPTKPTKSAKEMTPNELFDDLF